MKASAIGDRFARSGLPASAVKNIRIGLAISLAGYAFLMCPLAYLTFVLGMPVLAVGLLVAVLGAAPLLAHRLEKRGRD